MGLLIHKGTIPSTKGGCLPSILTRLSSLPSVRQFTCPGVVGWARYALLYLFSFIKLMSIYRSEIMHEISVETGLEASPKPLSYLLICKRSIKITSLIVLLCKIHCTFTLFKTEHIVWWNQENNVWPHLTYVRKKRKNKIIFEPMVGIKIESFIYKRNRNNLYRTTRTHSLMGLTHKLLCVRMMELCVCIMLQAYAY